jgi:hypothetical protein
MNNTSGKEIVDSVLGKGACDNSHSNSWFRALASAIDAAQAIPEICNWTQDSDGNYDTACKQAFTMIDGTPEQNGMTYCCYCGKRLSVIFYYEEVESEE